MKIPPERRRRLNSIIADILWRTVWRCGLRNKDLEPVLGSSGVTSEVISGKHKPSKQQVKKLASFFGASPEFFVSIDLPT
jgi:antitoxin component HigA of HigAB toxin-antitoxin module